MRINTWGLGNVSSGLALAIVALGLTAPVAMVQVAPATAQELPSVADLAGRDHALDRHLVRLDGHGTDAEDADRTIDVARHDGRLKADLSWTAVEDQVDRIAEVGLHMGGLCRAGAHEAVENLVVKLFPVILLSIFSWRVEINCSLAS